MWRCSIDAGEERGEEAESVQGVPTPSGIRSKLEGFSDFHAGAWSRKGRGEALRL